MRAGGVQVRIVRFVIGYVCVLIGGTLPQLDPEGRSVRLGPFKAWIYAWGISK